MWSFCCCSVTKSCPTLCDTMDCSTWGFSVLHYLPEFDQTHVPLSQDAIQPSHPLSPPSPFAFPASGSFPVSQFFTSDDQSTGVSASTSVLPMNIQDWFSLGLTGLISLQSKGLSGVFSSTTVQKCQFFSAQPSLRSNSHIIPNYWKNHSFDYMDFCCTVISLLFNMLSRFVIAILPRSKCLLILWVQSPSTLILET